jgi:uroporphyrinogen-III synthase
VSACDLAGLGVLVTRPAESGPALSQLIGQLGGVATPFPGVVIEPVAHATLAARLSKIATLDLVVFVSPTAVQLAMPALNEVYGSLEHVRVAAVGQSTAAQLRQYGVDEIVVPQQSSGGQALADCPQLRDVAGLSALVVRGEGGSDTLPSILSARGARLAFLECYRRRLPDTSFKPVATMLQEGRIGAWIATSGEILDNLFRLAGEHGKLLRNVPVFVNHPQVAARAFSQAVKVIFVTAGGDAGLASGLATWFCQLREVQS